MIGQMMSCFQSRRLSSRSSVLLLRRTLIVAVIACFHYQSAQGRYAVAYLQLVRLRRRATRFLIRNCLSYVAFGSKADINASERCPLYPPKADTWLMALEKFASSHMILMAAHNLAEYSAMIAGARTCREK